jgi:hypothetical protein
MASSEYTVEIERPVEETESPDGPVRSRGTFDLEANAAGLKELEGGRGKACARAGNGENEVR